jgi:hypothetical protein
MNGPSTDGFFTVGVSPDRYRLPHRPISLPVIFLIRVVIQKAIARLREDGFDVCGASEDKLTAALRGVIENDFRRTGCISGFNIRTFETVYRQAQVSDYTGKKLGKSPDLCFRLSPDDSEEYFGISEHDALFVECKPVDNTHPAGSKYCDDGLIRFVTGDYAWAMPQAMMIAYARHGRTMRAHLVPAMREPKRMKSLASSQLPERLSIKDEQDAEGIEPIHSSLHSRAFEWPHGKGKATDITIYHLWFDCN